ncbi:GyrI-like domain-containing protein [Aliiroseovarius sp. F47248L]|uniref:GyrI-like domain-containing protein n=1 Tax=Aliiroseovarius sp. F47248L TaxID=2926420 RepID=UPI001FF58B45|nr:GyrI-like domain-containing protein [Aliiroseovarius sp. F47248L]MCK0140467.1 GyrI-like domain-containing protein [Aliiroseovarius sp. F47248L]
MQTEMKPLEVVDAPMRTVVGTTKTYDMQSRTAIPAQWQAFFQADHQIEQSVAGAMYGICADSDSTGTFQYTVGQEVTNRSATLAPDLCKVELSEGRYAVRRAFGPMSELPQVFDLVFNKDLPAKGLKQRDGACFERYPDDSRNSADVMAYEIWVPVQ